MERGGVNRLLLTLVCLQLVHTPDGPACCKIRWIVRLERGRRSPCRSGSRGKEERMALGPGVGCKPSGGESRIWRMGSVTGGLMRSGGCLSARERVCSTCSSFGSASWRLYWLLGASVQKLAVCISPISLSFSF